MGTMVHITITSQGQATIPVAMRRKLGLAKSGGVLLADFDEQKNTLVLSKPIDVVELSERISRHIKPGTVPILDVNKYYQDQRETTA
jgi:bifunctional DNA-binding transcriptional regulator/antitoxin component of YhaV-PrlF toxin-antitoxin module